MKTTPTMVLFWGSSSIYSNWHPATFTQAGVQYANVEQYMMAAKALLFNDDATAAKIMAKTDPKQIKALGREVKGYIDELWVSRREKVVFRGCLAKFNDNPGMRGTLLETGARHLVEASPVDPLWGIGMAEDDPRAQDPYQWKGLNLLGNALMRVRTEMQIKYPALPPRLLF